MPVIVKMDVMGEDCDNAGPGCNKYAGECFQLITCIPDILTTLKSLERPGYSTPYFGSQLPIFITPAFCVVGLFCIFCCMSILDP